MTITEPRHEKTGFLAPLSRRLKGELIYTSRAVVCVSVCLSVCKYFQT